jgi:hypothetical protein
MSAPTSSKATGTPTPRPIARDLVFEDPGEAGELEPPGEVGPEVDGVDGGVVLVDKYDES